jgi:hypothetical protein
VNLLRRLDFVTYRSRYDHCMKRATSTRRELNKSKRKIDARQTIDPYRGYVFLLLAYRKLHALVLESGSD